MKSRNERLSEHLLQTDDAILNTAYEIDDPEKLKAYKKTKSAPITLLPRRAVWVPVVAAAACVALTVGLWQGGVFGSEKLPVEAPNEGTTEVTDPADTDVVTEPTDEPDADATTDGTADTATDTQHPDKTDTTDTTKPTATDKTDPTKTEKPATSVTGTTDKTDPTKNTTTGKDKPTTKPTTGKTKPSKPPMVIVGGTTTKTSVPDTTTTNRDKLLIFADEPDTYSSLKDEVPVMSVKGVYISPALEKKMKQYRGENVLYSVIVELPICLEDGESLESSAEWIAWEKEFSDVCNAFDAEAKRLNPLYDGTGPIKVWSDELYALRKRWDEVVAKRDELIKQYQETEHPIIRNRRVDFLKSIASTEIVPLSTDKRFYSSFSNDPNYAFFAELTAEEINTLTKQGGYVLRLKYPDGDRKGGLIDN